MIIFCSFVKIAKQKKIMNKRGNHAKKKKKTTERQKKNAEKCIQIVTNVCLTSIVKLAQMHRASAH